MMWQVLSAGFMLGLISSAHCIGMCGPLAMSLPLQGMSRRGRIWAMASYHLGRIGMYALLGIISGLIGRRIYIAGMQQVLSIVSGGVILLVVVAKLAGVRWRMKWSGSGMPGVGRALYGGLQRCTLNLWKSASGWRFAGIGLLNGLLPCGMVYVAMAAALSLPGVGWGGAFMAVFGAGTLPAFLLLSFSRRAMGFSGRMRIRRMMPFLLAGMAVLLILRGLNLGIPFISPVLASAPGSAISCH